MPLAWDRRRARPTNGSVRAPAPAVFFFARQPPPRRAALKRSPLAPVPPVARRAIPAAPGPAGEAVAVVAQHSPHCARRVWARAPATEPVVAAPPTFHQRHEPRGLAPARAPKNRPPRSAAHWAAPELRRDPRSDRGRRRPLSRCPGTHDRASSIPRPALGPQRLPPPRPAARSCRAAAGTFRARKFALASRRPGGGGSSRAHRLLCGRPRVAGAAAAGELQKGGGRGWIASAGEDSARRCSAGGWCTAPPALEPAANGARRRRTARGVCRRLGWPAGPLESFGGPGAPGG